MRTLYPIFHIVVKASQLVSSFLLLDQDGMFSLMHILLKRLTKSGRCSRSRLTMKKTVHALWLTNMFSSLTGFLFIKFCSFQPHCVVLTIMRPAWHTEMSSVTLDIPPMVGDVFTKSAQSCLAGSGITWRRMFLLLLLFLNQDVILNCKPMQGSGSQIISIGGRKHFTLPKPLK